MIHARKLFRYYVFESLIANLDDLWTLFVNHLKNQNCIKKISILNDIWHEYKSMVGYVTEMNTSLDVK